jgi:glycosyltransferase involved in cell wall biosynthesis
VGYAIESVLNQTLKDVELLIVDDGSTDATPTLIRQYRDPRIQIFPMSQNRGQFVAMAFALKRARGQYIAVLNSDDAFLPNKLETQVAFLEQYRNYGATFSDAELIDDSNQPYRNPNHSHQGLFRQENRTRQQWLHRFFFQGNCLCHPSVLIRRACHDLLGNYDLRFGNTADHDFWVRLCLHAEIHVFPEALVQFRIRANEANMGGQKPESRRRIAWERSLILRHFLSIPDMPEFSLIFPEVQIPPKAKSQTAIRYLVAQQALAMTDSSFHTFFGQQALFELMAVPEQAEEIERLFGFTYADLIRLSGERDPMNLNLTERLRRANKSPFCKVYRVLTGQRI